jgi:hypothetical protein
MDVASTNKIKEFLSGKKVTVVILGIAILSRIIQLIFFYNIRVDGMYQVMAMQNLVHGHGITTADVLPTDLSAVNYQTLVNWPPGYSLLLAPFYLLFGHNYIAAGMTIDILFAIILIFTCRSILRTLSTPLYLINLFTLFSGFFIYYFYFIDSSDAIAISFFAIAIHYTLLLLKKEKSSVKMLVGIILPLFLCGLIKYLFIPVAFVIPVFLLLKGYGDRNRLLKRTGLLIFFLTGAGLAGLLLYQKLVSGSAAYISEPTRGFFPGNLNNAYPFIPASFINPDSFSLLFSSHPSLLQLSFRVLQVLHIVLLLAGIIYMLRRLTRQGFKNIPLVSSFFYLVFFLSLAITLLLTLLSLRVAREENIPGHWWTYVEDARYYGLITVLVQLSVFVLYQLRSSTILKYALIVLLLPEMFRGMVFDAKRFILFNKESYSWQTELHLQQYADAIIQKEKVLANANPVVVTGSMYYLNYRVSLYSHVPVMSQSPVINDLSQLKTKNPVSLVVILAEKDLAGYNAFLVNKEKKLAGYLNGFYFYTLHVDRR